MLNQNQANSGLVYQGAKRAEKRTEKPYYNKEMLKKNYNTSGGNSANAGASRNEKYYINKQDYVQLPSKTKELVKISAAKLRSWVKNKLSAAAKTEDADWSLASNTSTSDKILGEKTIIKL